MCSKHVHSMAYPPGHRYHGVGLLFETRTEYTRIHANCCLVSLVLRIVAYYARDNLEKSGCNSFPYSQFLKFLLLESWQGILRLAARG